MDCSAWRLHSAALSRQYFTIDKASLRISFPYNSIRRKRRRYLNAGSRATFPVCDEIPSPLCTHIVNLDCLIRVHEMNTEGQWFFLARSYDNERRASVESLCEADHRVSRIIVLFCAGRRISQEHDSG